MKRMKILNIVLLILLGNAVQGQNENLLKSEVDSLSYSLGVQTASNLRAVFKDFDKELFIKGFEHIIDSTGVNLELDEASIFVQDYYTKNKEAIVARQKAIKSKELETKYGDNKHAGEAFLKANKTKKGVVTTQSGLQYMVLKKGTGNKPSSDSKVKVHYHGTLIDGTVFDSSVDRGEPLEFMPMQLIKGWNEGLQLMSVGAKYKFFIPQELAYKETLKGVLKPFSALIFEVELLEIIEE